MIIKYNTPSNLIRLDKVNVGDLFTTTENPKTPFIMTDEGGKFVNLTNGIVWGIDDEGCCNPFTFDPDEPVTLHKDVTLTIGES